MYDKPMRLQDQLLNWVAPQFDAATKITEMYGVEVELEGKGGITNPPMAVVEQWASHNDGSLRKLLPGDEAIEYVSRTPLDRAGIISSIKVLMDFLNSPGKQIYESYRTSIHVHANCVADKMIHVYNFITLCLLFDELFCSQNGQHRIGNNFCLRARDAQGQVMDLIESIEKHGHIFGLNAHNRYSSINFVSLLKFGTVEFRSLECTTDPLRIAHWIKTIDYMKQASRLFIDPQDIIRKFSQMSVDDFVVQILGPQSSKYLQVPNYQGMLFDGMRLAQDFAFCSKWIPLTREDELKIQNEKDLKFKKQIMQLGPAQPAAPMLAMNWVNNGDGWQIVEAGHPAAQAPGQFGEPQPAYAIDEVVDDDDDDEFWPFEEDEEDGED